jgi:hypothetical protein
MDAADRGEWRLQSGGVHRRFAGGPRIVRH